MNLIEKYGNHGNATYLYLVREQIFAGEQLLNFVMLYNEMFN